MAKKQQPKTEEKQQKKAQQDDSHEQHNASRAVAPDAQSESDISQKLDELMGTLNGDLTEIDADAALGTVDEWYNILHKSKDADAKELASGLKELQKLLKSDKATGHEIGEVLERLGEQTNNFASEADQDVKTSVQKLGKQLTHAGKAVGKAEDEEHLEEVNSLVETLEDGDLTSVEAESAADLIDPWYKLLHKSEGEQFQEIANSLKELKQAVKRSNPKPEAIAELLTRLGEQTTEIADEAPRGFKTVVQKLGKQLSKAGKAIESN